MSKIYKFLSTFIIFFTFAAAIERKLLLYWKSVFKTTHLGLNRRLAPVSMTTQIRAKKGPKMTRSTCIHHKSYSNVLYASFAISLILSRVMQLYENAGCIIFQVFYTT